MEQNIDNQNANQTQEKPQWYILHVYAGYESIVENDLKNMIVNNKLEDEIVDIKVPEVRSIDESSGKKKQVIQKKFPTYVFIKMIYSTHNWYLITQTRGVTGFVGPKGRPLPLTEEEVKRMELEIVEIENIDMKIGDLVKVNSGVLADNIGVIKSINEAKQTVKIAIDFFGKETNVELSFAQIDAVSV